jgi:hypothetical protein
MLIAFTLLDLETSRFRSLVNSTSVKCVS